MQIASLWRSRLVLPSVRARTGCWCLMQESLVFCCRPVFVKQLSRRFTAWHILECELLNA